MAPMNETTDKAYYEGWNDGYKHAIDDVRQELLTLEHGNGGRRLPIKIYEMLNCLHRTELQK